MRQPGNKKRAPQQAGQSIVEFALVMPLLLGVLLVIIELSILLTISIGLTNTAREIARAGATYQYTYNPATPPSQTPSLASLDTARTMAMEQELAAALNPLIDTTQLNPVAERYSYLPMVPLTNYRYGDRLAVTLEYKHKFIFGLIGRTITLHAASEMRLEPGGR